MKFNNLGNLKHVHIKCIWSWTEFHFQCKVRISTNVHIIRTRIITYPKKPFSKVEMILRIYFIVFFPDGVVVKMRFILTLMTAKYVVSCEKRGYIVLIIGYAKYCAFLHFIFAIIFRFIYMIILHLLSHRDIFLMHL